MQHRNPRPASLPSRTANLTSATPSSLQHSELSSLIKGLQETLADREHAHSVGSLRSQSDDLRKIRACLADDGPNTPAKNAFRQIGGFGLVIDVLESLNGFFKTQSLSRDARIDFFNTLKSTLDVLSEALNDHSGNLRFFPTRVGKGGWSQLETALIDTGLGQSDEEDSYAAQDEALEILFGLLLAFAVAQETLKDVFRGIQKLCEQPEAGNEDNPNHDDASRLQPAAEWAVREHIRGRISGNEILCNPDILPVILHFWNLLLHRCQQSSRPTGLLLALPMALRAVQSGSERNEIAMHNSRILRPLLEVYQHEIKFPQVKTLLHMILNNLLEYGLNDLNDAYLLFQTAPASEQVADLVLAGMHASKNPPFVQFDLSLHGFSSIELPSMGRQFPPTSSSSGYTIMAWVRFDEFDERSHTTIFGASDATETCFVLLFLEKDDRQLVLQTSVKDAPKASVRFRSASFREDRWYHIAIVHRKPRTTSSSRAALFINGVFMEQPKCPYPSSPPLKNSSAESFASITGTAQQYPAVQAFLGTPQTIAIGEGRDMITTRWSMASFYLFQDAISDEMIQVYQALGSRYVGNFQDSLGSFQTYRASAEVHLKNEQQHASSPDKSELMSALRQHAGLQVPESKIIISFSPTAILDNEDRNHINESKLIKSLPKEAASTLHRILRSRGTSVVINSAINPLHEAISASHGLGFLVGDPVTSVPQALDDACWRVGGSAPVVLKLLDLARTKDEVIRAIQIVFASLENNWRNSEAIERENAYGVLAGLMREKLGFGSLFGDISFASQRPPPLPVDLAQREEVALELLRMTLKFVGYSETKPETAVMINSLAYRFLLVDFDTWRRAPIATQKVYYGQFVHYAAKGNHHKFNAKRLIRMRIVKRLIDALKAESFSADVFPDFLEAFNAVFRCSISADTLRSLALFVTYALQENRAFPTSRRLPSRNEEFNGNRPPSQSRERSLSRVSPFNPPISPMTEMSRFEVGVQMLELFTDVLCEPKRKDVIEKFATTVTKNWLLFLLAEQDSRIIVLAMKILVRTMVIHGSSYVKSFHGRVGGFSILKLRLKTWWSVPALWISLFALLFGVDVATLDYMDDFNQFTLSDMFVKTGGKVVYPEVLPIISTMLESGLRAVVVEGQKAAGRDSKGQTRGHEALRVSSLNVDVVRGHTTFEVTNNAEVLNTVIRFLADLHLKSPHFREFSATSHFIQELLFALYPVVVTSENVSAETELNSRGSVLTFEGQDVVIRAPTSNENQRPPIVRTTSVPSTNLTSTGVPKNPRATFRRPSSFILVTNEAIEVPKPARFNAVISHHSTLGPIEIRIGSSIVQNLLGVVIAVFLDQVLHRREFPGFGIFLKVPPGFQEHQAYFESYVLSHTMSELSNTLRMQDQLMKEPKVITNIARYFVYMAEAIFEGWFLNGAVQLLDFVGQVLEYLQRPDIAKLKNVRLCSQAISSMKRVFFRIALQRLSELDDITDQKATIAFLERLSYWQMVILPPDNDEHYYIRLLFFLLYFRIISKVPSIRNTAVDFWRMLLVQKQEEATHVLTQAAPSNQKLIGSHFMRLAELDNEMFLVWVDNCRSELDSLFLGSMTRYWDEFVAEENKRTEDTAQTRLNKRRERLKQWNDEEKNEEDIWRKHESATSHWRTNVYASERLKHQRAMQDQQDNLSFMAATLEKFDRVLKGSCALFEKDPSFKWRLDETEGMNRMRLRLIPDRTSTLEDLQPRRKTSEQQRQRAASRSMTTPREADSSPMPLVQEPGSMLPTRQRADSRASSHAPEEEYEIVEDPRTDEGGDFEDKNRKVMRTLQRNDVVQHVYNVSRIDGLEALEGLLIVGKHCLYIIDHYFQRADGEVVGVWQAPIEERDSYLRLISGRETRVGRPKIAPGERTARHWRWADVMLVSKRRFLQRDVALELFFTDGRSYLLTAMSSSIRNELHSSLVARAPLLNNLATSMHPEDQWRVESLRSLEDAPQSFGSKFASVFNSAAANPATRKWMRGEISNFAYLMQINTMAGRSFNDLTQYPVFPWVLADYHSKDLDLTDPHTFRDLSKPMGCQHPSREAEFRERYNTVAEMTPHPPFHYGTHYSNAMTVAGYLIRLQPFVKTHLLLQGGYFDHADRLFYSVEKAWLSASKDQATDVRELTPEFFYLPEFLVNLNGYDFGTLQASGKKINDVTLPPWAYGDPHIFIQKHREALESPYVSAHLHKWIDLIFGFKQQGEAALEATNVFHYLSYHGATDLDAITDPHERLSSIGIIHNFGQTPRQLFTRPHPSRDDGAHNKAADLNVILPKLSRSHMPVHELRESISTLTSTKSDKVLCQGPFSLYVPPAHDVLMRWGFADGSVRFTTPDGKRNLGLYENFHIGALSTATFVDGRTLVTAGADSVITIWNLNVVYGTSATGATKVNAVDVSQRDSLFGHRSAITLLTASKGLSTLLSADTSGRVLLWDLNRNEFVRELHPAPVPHSLHHEIHGARISAATGDIALCIKRSIVLYTLNGRLLLQRDVCAAKDAADAVTCCCWYEGLRGEWLQRILLLTGHRDGSVRVWTKTVDERTGMWTLEYLRKLPPPSSSGGVGLPHGVMHGQQKGFGVPQSVERVPVSSILAVAGGAWVGDEAGRVYEWTADKHD